MRHRSASAVLPTPAVPDTAEITTDVEPRPAAYLPHRSGQRGGGQEAVEFGQLLGPAGEDVHVGRQLCRHHLRRSHHPRLPPRSG